MFVGGPGKKLRAGTWIWCLGNSTFGRIDPPDCKKCEKEARENAGRSETKERNNCDNTLGYKVLCAERGSPEFEVAAAAGQRALVSVGIVSLYACPTYLLSLCDKDLLEYGFRAVLTDRWPKRGEVLEQAAPLVQATHVIGDVVKKYKEWDHENRTRNPGYGR